MNYELTEEHLMIQKAARDFAVNELLPGVIERDEKQKFPAEQIKKLGELGFLGMMVDPKYGGAGLDTISYVLAMEEISKIDASTSVCMSVNNSLVCWGLETYGNEAQKQKYLVPLAKGEVIGAFLLSEPEAGSDATSQRTTAEDKGDHYLLNGTKNWITNGNSAGTYLVIAQTHPEKGSKGINALIVEKSWPGVTIGAKENKLVFEPIESPFAKRIKGIYNMYERISKSVFDTVKSNWFPVVLSGDHSTAGATIAGLKMAHPKAKLGVIWIDAHADLHTPYTTPSGNMHGMPLAASIAEDNLDFKAHELDDNTAKMWNALKNIGKISPKVMPEDIVFISLRDYEKEEDHLIKKYGMKVITTSEVRRKGPENISRSVFRYLSDCDYIYISFDVDSLDASISKGTGTPVSNGLREREAEDLIAKFMQHRKICCFEITEVNPTLDRENLMAEIAFNILQRSVNVLMVN